MASRIEFLEKLLDERGHCIVLLNIATASNQKLYVFLKTTKTLFKKLLRFYELRKPIILLNYGEILYSGYGDSPPDYVKQFIAQEYQVHFNDHPQKNS